MWTKYVADILISYIADSDTDNDRIQETNLKNK